MSTARFNYSAALHLEAELCRLEKLTEETQTHFLMTLHFHAFHVFCVFVKNKKYHHFLFQRCGS